MIKTETGGWGKGKLVCPELDEKGGSLSFLNRPPHLASSPFSSCFDPRIWEGKNNIEKQDKGSLKQKDR